MTRHSAATDVTVSLGVTNRELVLTIADDGRGLPERVIEGGGLTGMRERALLIGGDLRIEQSAVGVAVTLRLSLDQ